MITLKNLSKYYRHPCGDVIALNDITFHLMPGEYVSIVGPKSSGKSTLITLIGCMDLPTGGFLQIMDTQISGADNRTLDNFRTDHIGMVSGDLKLHSQRTITEIIQTQLHFRYRTYLPEGKSEQVMNRVGIPYQYRDSLTWELPEEMQVRGSIAKALANDPEILLCDEPTKNLDSVAAQRILTLLEDINRQGILVIIATEEIEIARRAHRQIGSVMGIWLGIKPNPPYPIR